MRKRPLLFIIGVVLVAAVSSAPTTLEPAAPPARRVLFIGNSYTYFNNLPGILLALAEAAGRRLEVRMVAPGGWRLKDHWEKGEALKTLRDGRWDYVILQDQSTLGVNLYVDGKTRVDGDAEFRPSALKWGQEIARSGAMPVFYLTWSRKASPEDQDRLTSAYMTAARESRARVAPVGLAWKRVREQHPEIELFQPDGSHPTPAGSYLAACVIYSALFDQSPAGLPGRIGGNPVNLDTGKVEEDKTAVLVDLQPGEIRTLQSTAWAVWRELKEQGGYLSITAPDPPALAPLPEGVRLAAVELEGTWKGELLFHPSGPIQMTLQVRRAGDGWTGRLALDYRPQDIGDESADLERLDVAERTITFAFPRSPATADLRIDFRAVATGPDELSGTAEASRSLEGGSLRLLGTWHARRQ